MSLVLEFMCQDRDHGHHHWGFLTAPMEPETVPIMPQSADNDTSNLESNLRPQPLEQTRSGSDTLQSSQVDQQNCERKCKICKVKAFQQRKEQPKSFFDRIGVYQPVLQKCQKMSKTLPQLKDAEGSDGVPH